VQCGFSRETARRGGRAEYGYCASRSRYFWLWLPLVCTRSGLPALFALAGAKADERETLLDMLEAGEGVVRSHPGRRSSGSRITPAAPSATISPSVIWWSCARS
jgi:hypothetical protein